MAKEAAFSINGLSRTHVIYGVGGTYSENVIHAAPYRQLYRLKVQGAAAWVLWWHADGTPGVVKWPFHFDHPSQEQNWADEHIAVLPDHPGSVQLAVITSPNDAASKARVLSFIHDAVARQISAYQAHEIADMLAVAGPAKDPATIAWLKGVADGTTMLADVEPSYPSKEHIDLYVVKRPPGDNHFQELRYRIATQYAAANTHLSAGSPPAPVVATPGGVGAQTGAASPMLNMLRNPETAIPSIIQMIRTHTVPKEAPGCLQEAAIKDDKPRALEIADYIDGLDPDVYVKTLVELLVNPNPDVRAYALSHRLKMKDRWKKVNRDRVVELYNAATDPKIRQELRDGICIYVAPEITSRYKTDEFIQAGATG